MDAPTFDRWTAAIAPTPTRRGALRLLSGLGLTALLGQTEVEAKRKKKRKKKRRAVPPPPVSPPPPPSFCAGKNECLTMDATCAAPGAATMCFCFARADAGHLGESFCAGEAGAGPVADCALCPAGEVCLDFTGCGGGLGCRQPCPNPL